MKIYQIVNSIKSQLVKIKINLIRDKLINQFKIIVTHNLFSCMTKSELKCETVANKSIG